jgi:hypothetical protein
MSTHTDEELNYVLETCERVAEELGIFDDAAYTGETKRGVVSGYDFGVPGQEESQAIRGTSRENPQEQPSLRATVSGKRL